MIVLDSSAAVEIARGTDMGLGFQALMLEGEEVIAPDLLVYETNNALLKYVRAGRQTLEETIVLGQGVLALVDKYISCEDLWSEVLSQAALLEHASYDIFYLVLARRSAATLFTADKKLQRLCLDHGVNCVYLDEEF